MDTSEFKCALTVRKVQSAYDGGGELGPFVWCVMIDDGTVNVYHVQAPSIKDAIVKAVRVSNRVPETPSVALSPEPG